MGKVYVVSLEWNLTPPSAWAGDSGVVGVYATQAAADAAKAQTVRELAAAGHVVYAGGDNWDLDVHVTAHEVQP